MFLTSSQQSVPYLLVHVGGTYSKIQQLAIGEYNFSGFSLKKMEYVYPTCEDGNYSPISHEKVKLVCWVWKSQNKNKVISHQRILLYYFDERIDNIKVKCSELELIEKSWTFTNYRKVKYCQIGICMLMYHHVKKSNDFHCNL